MAIVKRSEVERSLETSRRLKAEGAESPTQRKELERELITEDFIESAPDGRKKKSKWITKGKKNPKVVITHTLSPEDLEALDELAESIGVSRASLINMMIKKTLQTGVV